MITTCQIKTKDSFIEEEKLNLTGEFRFNSGLNVIVGPNGSGKTVLLKVLAAHSAANPKSRKAFSNFVEPGVFPFRFDNKKPDKEYTYPYVFAQLAPGKLKASVAWDGYPTIFMSSGVVDDMPDSLSEDDVLDLGARISLQYNQYSAGQTRTVMLQQIQHLVKQAYAVPEWLKDKIKTVNDVWSGTMQGYLDYVSTLKGNGPPTLLLDEPDRNLSIESQKILWQKILPEWSKTYQIVAATHSPFSFFADANFIELVPEYVGKSRAALRGLEKSDEKGNDPGKET
jgi:predicted ATP-dependent endonuclease of OLD family